MCCAASMRAAACPCHGCAVTFLSVCVCVCVLCHRSVLHCDLPRVVMGSEDTGVHIYNLSALRAAVPTGKAGHSAAPGRPHLVNTLRGHRAPVAAVSWAFDESFLASADSEGTVICWERAATV